ELEVPAVLLYDSRRDGQSHHRQCLTRARVAGPARPRPAARGHPADAAHLEPHAAVRTRCVELDTLARLQAGSEGLEQRAERTPESFPICGDAEGARPGARPAHLDIPGR